MQVLHRALLRFHLAALLGVAASTGCAPRGCGSSDGAAEIVPPELADQQALAQLADWAGLPSFESGRYRVQSSEDRLGGEPVPNPLWAEGNRDMNHFVCASADAEPPPGAPPFLLDLPRCPDPWVRGYVLARFEGPGRLARLWMTAASVRRRPADREVLRIYVDDQVTPVVQVLLSRALDGSAGELFARPFGAGSSRRMAWHYPVVFGDRLVLTLDRLDPADLYFYQATAVLDAVAGPPSLSRRRAPQRLGARDPVLATLRSERPPVTADVTRTEHFALGPAETARLELLGPGTIVSASIRVAERDVALLDSLRLSVRWDGDEPPAIDTSLGALFATTLAPPELPSLALGATWEGSDLVVTLRLPMPFALGAEWSFTNGARRAVAFTVELGVNHGLPAEPWGHLAVQAVETLRTGEREHPIVSAIGPGRLVGVCIAMQGHQARRSGLRGHPMNFLEGDELGVVDGIRAFAGTGTEDYFDGAFYFEDAPSSSPFAQAWDVSDGDGTGKGRASACRWHVLGDEVDFTDALELALEIGPGAPEVIDRFRSVAFLYGGR